VSGITLYMQPVQDMTVEDRVSRTQYQYSMEDADAQELSVWATRLVDALRKLPAMRDVAPTSKMAASRQTWFIDRDTASRLGILPQAIDDALYDAFRQRQVSTIFTQLNQYHVVLEVEPQFSQNPRCAQEHLRSCQRWATGTLASFSHFESPTRARGESSGTVSGRHPIVHLAPGISLGEATKSD